VVGDDNNSSQLKSIKRKRRFELKTSEKFVPISLLITPISYLKLIVGMAVLLFQLITPVVVVVVEVSQ